MSDRPRTDARAARLALERLLEADAPHLAPILPPRFADAAEAYVSLLLDANARLNLTRVVEPEAVARLHLLDSLAALPLLDVSEAASAVDLGSGGGVPGVVLALARPDVAWTLVDAVRKKADALRSFADALRLTNVTVVAERAEILGRGAARESHDAATARACAALPVLAEYALPLVRIGGSLLAWKGRIGSEELEAGEAASAVLGGGPTEVRPSVVAGHSFVLVPKVGPTPERYPRRPGLPARRPLP
ncbi:MAG TPA: 16S rRNA (guanine(527)-N(7))-methyltransferase RsmG [Candidatus Limnocylindria bacterium]|nr:16S rRNA (guanine(527)-N(7))-methyltransferase RsmG [Candidatus Limnocylindria bacterium]